MEKWKIRDVVKPGVLHGVANGKIPASLLVTIPGPFGGPPIKLVEPAARAWLALSAAAKKAGHILTVAGPTDSYRSYQNQVRTFTSHYSTQKVSSHWRKWGNTTYYRRPGKSVVALPGASNHGWGLAVDVASEVTHDDHPDRLSDKALSWLIDNELRYGFSHELDERWHIRYFRGDDIPDAVLDFEDHHPSFLGEIDMPLTDADVEKIVKAVWARNTDPAGSRMAYIALNEARARANSALDEVKKMRHEFATFAKQDVIDDKTMLKTLLTSLGPDAVAEAIAELPGDVAGEIAGGISDRVNAGSPDGAGGD